MIKKMFVVMLLVSLMTAVNLFSFEDVSKDGEKGKKVGHAHWIEKDKLIIKYNYDSLWNSAVALEKSKAGKNLIENCIKSYGGREHLAKINSLQMDYISKLSLVDRVQTVTKYFKKDLMHKIDIFESDTLIMTRIIADTTGWIITPNGSKVIEEVHYMRDLAAYLALTMPLGIETESFSEKKYGTRVNDSLGYIYLKSNEKLIVILGIDPADHMIKSIEGIVIREATSLAYIERYTDFRDFDGYIFPYRKTFISMGLEVSNSALNSLKINPIINNDLFSEPSK